MKGKLFFTCLTALTIAICGSAQTQQTKLIQYSKTPKEKQNWIRANDSLSKKKIDGANALKNANTAPKKSDNNSPSGQLVAEPGFPAYVNTGDKAKDDANYAAAKSKWIADHPERYKEMTSPKQQSK